MKKSSEYKAICSLTDISNFS